MRKSEIRSIWVEQGFASPRLALIRGEHAQFSPNKGERLRSAFERLGGLFAAFGSYISGRSDLLPSSDLSALRQIRVPLLASLSADSLPGFGARIQDPVPLGTFAFSRNFRAMYDDRTVIVEVFTPARKVVDSREWNLFRKGLRTLRAPGLDELCQDRVLNDFRRWLVLLADVKKKRRILETLQQMPDGCVARIPRLVPELQDEGVLAYEAIEGRELEESLELESEDRSHLIQLCCEFFLESSLFLGIISAASEARQLKVTADGGVAPLVWPALETVPAELTFEFLQYVTSAIAGDQSRALHMLSRLGGSVPGGFDEERVRDQLSAQHGDLDVELTLPESARALDDIWKALMKSGFEAPSFLSLFHRHVLYWGQLNARFQPTLDLISDSIWPVLGRVIRLQMGETLSVQKTREWLAGSGLTFLGMFRQFGIMMEQLRANDLAVSIRMDHGGNGTSNGRGRSPVLVAGVLILAVFLVALHTAFTNAGSVAMVATAVVALSGIGLFISLARLN